MVFTGQKSRVDANPESSPKTQPVINIHELRTPSHKVFTQEQNELFVHQILQYSQDLEGEIMHYYVLFFNESPTEDYFKTFIVNWLFDLTLTKMSIHRLLLCYA